MPQREMIHRETKTHDPLHNAHALEENNVRYRGLICTSVTYNAQSYRTYKDT